MPSVVDICNRALSHTGTDQTVTSLDEKSKEARILSRWYFATRDQLLRAFAWNFAQRRVTLADMGDAPDGWAYRYRYPTDCLDLQRVYHADAYFPGYQGVELDREPFVVASSGDGGRVILTNLDDAEALYTARISDPNLFPPDFATALEFTLAANIAMPMVANPQMTDFLAQRARGAMSEAIAANLNEAVHPEPPEAEWIRDRFGGTVRRGWHGDRR